MSLYVALALILILLQCAQAPPPMRLTIDCPANDKVSTKSRLLGRQKSYSGNSFDIDSFCDLINNALPKAVEDGRFVLVEDRNQDQDVYSNTLIPKSVPPPLGFVPNFPKLMPPKLRIPKLKVPTLTYPDRPLLPPKLGLPITLSKPRSSEEETSAEKMEKFKKGVQKMLHVVKVLGQIDQYLSERTRIIIEKLSKTLAE